MPAAAKKPATFNSRRVPPFVFSSVLTVPHVVDVPHAASLNPVDNILAHFLRVIVDALQANSVHFRLGQREMHAKDEAKV